MQRSELWQRIRAARKRAGMYQWQVADALGIDKSAVTQWESKSTSRRTRPDISRLETLARLTRTPLWWLMSDDVSLDEPWPTVEDEAQSAAPPDRGWEHHIDDFWTSVRLECRRRRQDLWAENVWHPVASEWDRPLLPFARTRRSVVSVLTKPRTLWSDVVADLAKLYTYSALFEVSRKAYLVWRPTTKDIPEKHLGYLNDLDRLVEPAHLLSDRIGIHFLQVVTADEAAEYLSQIL